MIFPSRPLLIDRRGLTVYLDSRSTTGRILMVRTILDRCIHHVVQCVGFLKLLAHREDEKLDVQCDSRRPSECTCYDPSRFELYLIEHGAHLGCVSLLTVGCVHTEQPYMICWMTMAKY